MTPENHLIMSINIHDPINVSNNIGKQVNFAALQTMFKAAYFGLHANIQTNNNENTNKNTWNGKMKKGKRLRFAMDTKKLFIG